MYKRIPPPKLPEDVADNNPYFQEHQQRQLQEESQPKRHVFVNHSNALTEDVLLNLLTRLSWKLFFARHAKTTLVVHGGIVSVLGSRHRRSTSDVDYIARVLPEELEASMSVPVHHSIRRMLFKTASAACLPRRDADNSEDLTDPNVLIRMCIAEVAIDFNKDEKRPFDIERDWMNSDADVALPWYLNDELHMVDPISEAACTPSNIVHNTIFDSPGLRLVAIPGMWSLALKLQRYTTPDELDIGELLATSDNVPSRFPEQEFALLIEQILRKEYGKIIEYDRFPRDVRREWSERIERGVSLGRVIYGSYLAAHGRFEDERRRIREAERTISAAVAKRSTVSTPVVYTPAPELQAGPSSAPAVMEDHSPTPIPVRPPLRPEESLPGLSIKSKYSDGVEEDEE